MSVLPQIESEALGENAVWQVCSTRWAARLPGSWVTTRPPRNVILLKGRFHRRRCISAANVQELVSAPLEEANRQVTGVVIEFNRKHAAFRISQHFAARRTLL
jgi:hypothetical protein